MAHAFDQILVYSEIPSKNQDTSEAFFSVKTNF